VGELGEVVVGVAAGGGEQLERALDGTPAMPFSAITT
jgi:hypothetical protein